MKKKMTPSLDIGCLVGSVTNDALYSNKSNRNLLSFKDIRRNEYHIETMNHYGNEYLLITGKKQILEQLIL